MNKQEIKFNIQKHIANHRELCTSRKEKKRTTPF